MIKIKWVLLPIITLFIGSCGSGGGSSTHENGLQQNEVLIDSQAAARNSLYIAAKNHKDILGIVAWAEAILNRINEHTVYATPSKTGTLNKVRIACPERGDIVIDGKIVSAMQTEYDLDVSLRECYFGSTGVQGSMLVNGAVSKDGRVRLSVKLTQMHIGIATQNETVVDGVTDIITTMEAAKIYQVVFNGNIGHGGTNVRFANYTLRFYKSTEGEGESIHGGYTYTNTKNTCANGTYNITTLQPIVTKGRLQINNAKYFYDGNRSVESTFDTQSFLIKNPPFIACVKK